MSTNKSTIDSGVLADAAAILFAEACQIVRAYDMLTGFGLHETLAEMAENFGPEEPAPVITFRLAPVSKADGSALWTVVKDVDGVAQGGDHHWLTSAFAEAALAIYEKDPSKHGKLRGIVELGQA
jgi:hypothetical protein